MRKSIRVYSGSSNRPLAQKIAEYLGVELSGLTLKQFANGEIYARYDEMCIRDRPNAQNELARIDVRMAWDDAYRGFLSALERETGKPVVTCGDFNVAHEEIDLKNPKSNRGNAGFSDEEMCIRDRSFCSMMRSI